MLEAGPFVCERCETLLPANSQFCPGCGDAFEEPVPTETEPFVSRVAVPPAPRAPRPPEAKAPVFVEMPPPAGNAGLVKTLVALAAGLLVVTLLSLGFALLSLAGSRPHTETVAFLPPPSVVTPPPAVPPTSAQSASSADASVESPASETSTPQDAPNVAISSPSDHTADNIRVLTNDAPTPASNSSPDDTMTKYAPRGSGLSDAPLSVEQLQNTAIPRDELAGKSLRALSVSHNTIYALHGYIFERPSIRSYFAAQPWYHPDPSFSSSRLSSLEQQNAQTLRAAERAQFGYGRASFDAQGQPVGQSRDPLKETASSGSGLSDRILDLDTLQNHFLSDSDLEGKSLAALSISYNEIYAAHGYTFKRPSLQQLFDKMGWHKPNPSFAESDLSSTEKANLQTIRAYERRRFGF